MIVFIFVVAITASSAHIINKGGRQIFSADKVEPIGKNVSVFRSEKILAEVNFVGDRAVHCRLSSVFLPKDEERIDALFKNVTRVGDEKMIKWVTTCGKLETHVIQETPFEEAYYLVRKIYPGTLWCGPGNIAETYNSLGRKTETDRCCRNHDFCPVCIPSHTDRYAWNRTFEFSVVSCECDMLFHDCLLKASANDYGATVLREVYFEVYNAPCVGYNREKPVPFRIKDVLSNTSIFKFVNRTLE